jgi:multidrug efflux pump subunit AcrA (membrane-fusion protein)
MADIQTPQAETQAPAARPAPAPAKKKNRPKGRAGRRIVVLVLAAAVVLAAVLAVRNLLFGEEEQEILRDTAGYGSISNEVQGYGYTKALSSASITLTTGGMVQEVFVSEGDFVTEGDPLYTIDSTDAYAALEEAQKTVSNYQKQLQAIYDSYNDLTVRPPFNGKLLLDEMPEITVGSNVGAGTTVARLVDDSRMKLTLYYNYAYEDDIFVGQTARVSIPVSMSQVTGQVEEIDKVRYITPEGTVCFQVVIAMDNPGTLTAGMGAAAVLTGAGGEDIYAYDSGKLAYSRTADIVTKAGGEVLSVQLMNYADVTTDQVLLQLSAEDNDDQIAALENQLKTAQESLTRAQENLANFNAVAPISGTVLSCGLTAGERVSENTTAIVIADTSVMTVDISVDERSISYVKLGMEVELTDWNDNAYVGTVTNVSLTGTMENGAASFPVTVQVDNPDGSLMSNMSINYSFQASQADWCLMVPVQSVKNVSDAEGNAITVVFVEKDQRPDNAVTLPEGLDGVPTEDEGFYAVPVEVGISDVYNAEIRSGLEDGDTVFTSYMSAGSYY